ncbi:hypothetical protein [Paenibacillus sp. FSL H8-0332]|uniref:hypothetical protein n=1 Tax=Paenibacillus sp. FSL H8-0332 TaxID=2954742 RepID=UPI0030CC0BEB
MAQQARGYDIKDTKGLNRVQAYIQLVIPLLVTTLARVLTYARMDYAAGGIMLAYVLLGILLER